VLKWLRVARDLGMKVVLGVWIKQGVQWGRESW